MQLSREQILYDYAMSLAGVPYKFGGSNPLSGLDCSGLCVELLQSIGLLPHGYDANAQGLYEYFSANGKGSVALKPLFGALSFYGKGLTQLVHVGFCLDDKVMIEAAGGDSSVIDRTTAIAKNAFVKVRPVMYRKDFCVMVLPKY